MLKVVTSRILRPTVTRWLFSKDQC